MKEQVVVDFSRVDAALKLVARERELIADRESAVVASVKAEATTRIIKYAAAACALVIVSVGVAIWLAKQRHVATVVRHPPLLETGSLPTTQSPTVEASAQNKIVTKITLFNSMSRDGLNFGNPYISGLTAGHEYRDSNAERWEFAWCYADFRKDGIEYTVRLANRNGAATAPRAATPNERQQLGLSEADVSLLRARCPWKEQ